MIDGYAEDTGHPYVDSRRPFVGRFEFEQLPRPLEPVRVHYTLTACELPYWMPDGDWDICFVSNHYAMDFIGDTVVSWPGPHSPGSTLTGSFMVRPISSSHGTITVFTPKWSFVPLRVSWCFEKDGSLSELKRNDNMRCCNKPRVTFFDGDTIVVRGTLTGPESRELFTHEYSVFPPFRVGDTSTMLIHLVSLADAPHGADMSIDATGFDIVEMPACICDGIQQGDTLSISLLLSPMRIRSGHGIGITLREAEPLQSLPRNTHVTCQARFKADSSLRYIAGGLVGSVPDSLLPLDWPKSVRGDMTLMEIHSNGSRPKVRKQSTELLKEIYEWRKSQR